ncbi:MAG: response regulator [Ignavibacteriales bacterium]|nr:response regulator [Ignavibacteriales bacterium]
MQTLSNQANILLVDDDDAFLNFLATVLQDEYSHRVVKARSGHEAVSLLKDGKTFFDMMFLDYYMPEVNGLGVMKWMQQEGIETPVVMLTGAGNEEIAVEAMKLGAYDYLRKEQIDIQHLGTVIEATRERRLFRIARQEEEEKAREIFLNKEATEKVRTVINAITPALNSALADIAVELEIHARNSLEALPEGEARVKMNSIVNEIRRQVNVLESGINGLLSLYQLVYARHEMSDALSELERELEERISQLLRRSGGD